jgi:hypothetical protein
MGLLDQVLGNVLGGRPGGGMMGGGLGGGMGGRSGGGGMSPIMIAVLGLLAQKAMSGRGSSGGGGLGICSEAVALAGCWAAAPEGLGAAASGAVADWGALLGAAGGGSGGGLNGGALASGLGGLLDSFHSSGHGDIANSWIGTGDNRPIAPDNWPRPSDRIRSMNSRNRLGCRSRTSCRNSPMCCRAWSTS